MKTTRTLLAALLIAMGSAPTAAFAQATSSDTCQAMPTGEGVVVSRLGSRGTESCKPNTGMVLYTMPSTPLAHAVAILCDTTKVISFLKHEGDRTTAFCTYRGAAGAPDVITGGSKLIIR